MATSASPDSIAGQARRLYTEELVKGLAGTVQAVIDTSRTLLDKPSEHAVFQRRRDLVQALMKGAQQWHRGIVAGLRRMISPSVGNGPCRISPCSPCRIDDIDQSVFRLTSFTLPRSSESEAAVTL